jgi:hypothetical protein
MSTLLGPAHVCPVCGLGNDCRRAAREPAKGTCWCERMEVAADLLRQFPDLCGRACLCERCLTALSRGETVTTRDEDLREGRDFYVEAGAVVFTARYLAQRGFCCGSGCRHCPYEMAAAATPRPAA